MSTTTHDFRLHFVTDIARNLVLRIPRANSTLGASQISDAMEGIIRTEAVMANAGMPLVNANAELVTTTRNEFNIYA